MPGFPRNDNEDGAVATEYVLLATLIGMAILTAAGFLGEKLRDFFSYLGTLV